MGTGTAASCTFQSLKTALLSTFDPLLVTFNCGANPVVINVTSEITFSNISGSQDITIDGGTPGLITLNATSGRIINQRYLGNLTVKNLTFSAGSVVNCASAPCGGGAIFNPTGILTVINSTFTGNSATGSLFGGAANGGAIYSRGLLTVTGSTFTNNQALAGNGGAIYTFSATIANTRFSNNTSTFSSVTPDDTGRGGALYARGSGGAALTLVITGSSFTGNTAGEYGGAIFQPSSIYADSFVVTNSTFSGNSAQVDGGALAIGNPFGGGTTKVTNATISGNSVLNGVNGTAAGIWGLVVSLTNTIVSNNAPGNCSGSFSDGGGNVVFGDTTCPGINANPFLGTLTGTLPYFPLVAGSAAINRGIAGECAAAMASPAFGAGGVDQRGMPRRSLYCDSGAFEAQPASLAVVAGSNQGAAVNTQFATVLQAQVRDSVNNKLAGSVVTFTGPASGAGIVNGGGSLSGAGGIAFLGATANGTLGTYNVTVTATGATPANFSLTNRNPNGVTYDGNGETGGSVPVDGNYYRAAGIVTVSGNTGSLTRIGSTFAGWNTAANGTGTNYLGGNTFAINANVILYARWTPVTYGVTYNANGSTGGTAPVDGNSYAPGSTVVVMANTGALVKTGSTFAGWNTAANGGTTYATGATFAMGSANVILYARWTPVTYGVTYNANGSTGGTAPVDGDAYAAGATVIVLGNNGVLVKTGSTFAGWNTAANGGTTYAGGATFAMGSANVILYARWTPVTYGVTYNANGSTGGTAPVDGNAYAPGATVTVLGNTGVLVKTGATFAGWNIAANGGGTTYLGGASFAMGSANVILYARWTPVTYGVTYNANGSTGGAVPADGSAYAPGSTVIVLANTGGLVKTGATFAGWNSAINGTGVSYPASGNASFAMGSANVILYAQWSNPCTLDLDGNNQVDPLTDHLMLLRAMFGLTGTAVTNGAIGSGTPARPTWDKIQPYLNANCGTSFLP